MRATKLTVSAWVLALVAPSLAVAEPAFAVRTGHRCSQCHLNRTGGGLRTPFGSLYTQTVLPNRLLPWRKADNLLPADPDARFAVGADARVQYLALNARAGPDSSSFEVPEANLYAEARLVPGRFSLYLDESVGPGGASARELFALWTLPVGNGYLKGGKFLPPFGWRLPDDAAFIRRSSGFTYSAPDQGLELGFEPGRWSFHLAAVNGSGGSDNNRSKKFTLLALRRLGPGRLGLSAANDIAAGVTTTHAGLLGGVNLGRLALLAEADWVELSREPDTTQRLLAWLEADLLIARGLNLKLAHDWIDPDRDVRTDARVRDSLGLELVPYPFVQLRWVARRLDGPPQVAGARDRQVEFELHLFF